MCVCVCVCARARPCICVCVFERMRTHVSMKIHLLQLYLKRICTYRCFFEL